MTADEDRDAAVVRTLLAGVEPPPGRIAATGLLTDGRRARRRRRSAVTVAGVSVLTAAMLGGVGLLDRGRTPDPAAPGRDGAGTPTTLGSATPAPCTATALELPPKATTAEVNGGSPSGRYLAGFSSVGEALATPVRWDGAKAQPIGVAGPAEAQDVNDGGVVVGKAQSASGKSFAWAFAGGRVTRLPVPAGYTGAEANAINARGEVAGVLFGQGRTAAAVWRGTGATARVDVLDGADTMAFGISDSGVVVGARDEDGESYPYEWDAQGRGHRLTLPAGYAGGGADGVRGDWAYGLLRPAVLPGQSATQPGGNQGPRANPPSRHGQVSVNPNVGALWNLRTGRVVIVTDSEVKAASAGGASVVNGPERGAALRAPDGTLRQLADINSGAASYAYALSDDGTRAAGDSARRPVLWNCSGRGN